MLELFSDAVPSAEKSSAPSAWGQRPTKDHGKMSKFSDLPVDKMQAALAYDCADCDNELRIAYQSACKAWFETLSDENKALALLAAEAFADGDPTRAERIAAMLPPAPKYSV